MVIKAEGSLAEIKYNGSQLSKIKKQDPLLAIAEVVKLISMIFELVNVKRPLSEEGVLIVAEDILKDFWYMKIEEIEYCFKNGIKGKYGKILDRLDAPVIFGWLNDYSTSEEVIAISEKKGADFKKQEQQGKNVSILEMPEFRKRIMKEVIGKPIPTESTGEEKDAHRMMIKKQATEIMKDVPKNN